MPRSKRPATGAIALVVVSLVAGHGVEYLLAATILAGAFQATLAALRIAKVMRSVPQPGLVAVIPMAALVAVMVLVAVSTFDWHSVAPATLRRMPAGETLAMVVTVIATVVTHNLAIGVGVGVLTAIVVFARLVAHLVEVDRCLDPDGTTCIYSVTGERFFASDQEFIEAFEYAADPPKVIVDSRVPMCGTRRRSRRWTRSRRTTTATTSSCRSPA